MRYFFVIPLVIAVGAVSACSNAGGQETENVQSSQQGYVLKRGEGEALFDGQTLVKASPRTGSQGGEMFWSHLGPGFSTGIHIHHAADEFFYVVSGAGVALVGDKEVPIETGDVVFVPTGQDHRLKTSGGVPLEIVYLVDRPGLASEFRDGHVLSDGGKVPLTLEQLNQISQKYGTTYKTLE
ncbi:MAG: cupin domain-containing protein [Verrucomicrobia bacterium]|nr:cupin domain-containing protein [Verrucomicrobiota bacterium]